MISADRNTSRMNLSIARISKTSASLIGTPNSHGCVLMKNKDVSELFDVVSDKTIVLISLD